MTTQRPGATVSIIVGQLMFMIDAVIVTVALPQIREALGLDTVGLSWIVSAYALVFAGLLLVSGRIGTRVGPRQALIVGLGIFVLASAAGGFAPNGEFLIIARAVQGAGAALAAPSILVLLTANTSEGTQRLRAMSWYIIASSAGSAIGLILGGVLTVTLGWRWVMLVNVPIGIAVIVGTALFATEVARARTRIDAAGAVLSAIAMVAIVYGLTASANDGWMSSQVIAALLIAVLAIVALVLVERRVRHPVLPLRLLSGHHATPYLIMLLVPAGLIGFFTFSVLQLQETRGLDALLTGLSFLPWAVGVIVGGRLSARVVAAIGVRRTTIIGLVAIMAGIAAFVLLRETPIWLSVLVPGAIIGVGPGLVFTPATSTIMTAAGSDTGPAAALLQSMQQLGAAIGVAVLTTVYTAFARQQVPEPYVATIAIAVAFPLATLLITLLPGMHARERRGIENRGDTAALGREASR